MSIPSSLYHQLVWDYNLSQQQFLKLLSGSQTLPGLDQDWAIRRVLEHAPYYQAKKLVPLTLLKHRWPNLKPKIYRQDIKDGYEFLLHQHALSTTG